LKRKIITKLVDHQTGEIVRLSMNKTKSISLWIQALPQFERGRKSLMKKGLIDLFDDSGEESERNERVGVVEPDPEREPSGREKFNNVPDPGFPNYFSNFIAKYPGVTGENSPVLFFAKDNFFL
jgi:hypothetical protein